MSRSGKLEEAQKALAKIGGETIERHHLPDKLRSQTSSSRSRVVELPAEGYPLEEIEKEAVVQALEQNGWNQTKAAVFLQVPRHTLIYRMEKYGIKKS